ncbi:hypothetical protein BDN70DRAFT_888492 [Pholiota conissans]|uniref:Uncharacterized protein n=1 Tax=Pholiota conissans TaxID=109636 RepID=A0A9P5YL21_9AGAR|nr:hypothetical protein BDN70DRAFT_888492 [Pholiota conissans]
MSTSGAERISEGGYEHGRVREHQENLMVKRTGGKNESINEIGDRKQKARVMNDSSWVPIAI